MIDFGEYADPGWRRWTGEIDRPCPRLPEHICKALGIIPDGTDEICKQWVSGSAPSTLQLDRDTIRAKIVMKVAADPEHYTNKYTFLYGPDGDGIHDVIHFTIAMNPMPSYDLIQSIRTRHIEDLVDRIVEKHNVRKQIRTTADLDLIRNQMVHRYIYGPDGDGFCTEETFRINRDPPPASSTITDIKKYYMNILIERVIEEKARRKIAVQKSMNAIEKCNINPAMKKEENTMPINRANRMIPTLNGDVDITDIQIYNNKVVKVVFSDETFTKAVCGENDQFDLDIGITICVIKKMAGKDGHKWYNNLIRKAHAVMDHNAEAKKMEQDISNKVKEHNKKEQERRKAGKEKAKQEQIDIHSEAFLKAIKEWTETQEGLKKACGPAN